MNKWFGGIVTTLVVLVLTSLVGAWLKGPIDELASSDRLSAQVQLSPWVQRPDRTNSPSKSVKNGNDVANIMEKMAAERESELSITSGNTFQFARVTVTNESSKLISDISIRLEGANNASAAVVVDETGKRTVAKDSNRIKLPNMKPGDRVAVFLWFDYIGAYNIEEYFKSYSSVGKFRVRFDWPESQVNEYGSSLGEFLDDWAATAAVVFGLILIAFLTMYVYFMELYYKALLSSDRFYHAEQIRYEDKPKKFIPSIDKAEYVLKSNRGR